MASTYYVAWWNLENLFDEEDSSRRTDKVLRAIRGQIAGWTRELLDRKVAQLAAVIAQVNGGDGPDLLGVCEVENRFVLDLLVDVLADRLPGRSYGVVHADTADARGIDVALLHDIELFEVPAGQTFFHVVMRRNATRDILQANLRTRDDRTWAVFANHWPSRSGGASESSGYRQIAGETLAYFHERALEMHGEDTPVLAMGDFNDEPFDVSLVRHALSTRQQQKVLRARTPRFWNLMWPAVGQPDGTFYYQNTPNILDQFLVNRNMATSESAIRAEVGTVEILRFPGTSSEGTYPAPVHFGGMGKEVNEDGFSDHFPIGMQVTDAAA